MTLEALATKAKRYARAHPQEVMLAWIDGSKRTYDAGKAVCLCEVRRVAACLMGTTCADKKLENLLNEMIDFETKNERE